MNEKTYRVLSLDGGGIRGLYTASVLKSLVENFSKNKSSGEKDIGKAFDLIVGTSTGGILASGLAAGVSIHKIIELYRVRGKKIFSNPFPLDNPMKQLQWVFQVKEQSANPHQALIQELKNIFGDKTIAQMYEERKIALCMTAVKLQDHSPQVFKTPHNFLENREIHRRLIDILLATSSAPVYFPIAHIADPTENTVYEDFADGGLWANSPILVALREAMSCAEKEQKIEIVSIGTCPPPAGEMVLNRASKKGGLSQWHYGVDLVELAMDSQARAHHSMADFLCTQFKSFGKEVIVHRLKQTAPPLSEAKLLSIDQANEKACSLLMKYGEEDGMRACKETESEGGQILKNIFSHLPDFTV